MTKPQLDVTEHPYPLFAQALRKLAPTIPEIATILGVSPRSVDGYLAGRTLPHTKTVKQHPVIDLALSLDFAARHMIRAPAPDERQPRHISAP